MRGMERRKAHRVEFSLPASRAKRWCFRKRIASLRSIAAILGEGTVLLDGTASLIRPAFAAFIRIPCSRERRSHVVGPDGDPSLPDATGANRARRRRILLRFKAPSRSAPRERDDTEYNPIAGNVKMGWSFAFCHHRACPGDPDKLSTVP